LVTAFLLSDLMIPRAAYAEKGATISSTTMDPTAIADLLVEITVARFGDEIGIIACYGSRARGDDRPGSDLDIFYVPADGCDPPAARAFVVGEITVDFWPIRWETAERIVTGRFRSFAVAPSIIGDAKILHARSEEDRARFETLRARRDAQKAPDRRADMIRLALDAFRATVLHLENLRQADDAGVRVAAARLVQSVLTSLALAKQEAFSGGWDRALAARPEGFRLRANEILTSPETETVRTLAEALVADTRRLLREMQESACPPEPLPTVLRGAYAEFREHVDKLIAACESGDRIRASLEAVTVQDELSLLLGATRSGVGYGDFNRYEEYGDLFEREGFPDLLSAVDDLPRLARRARALDEAFREWLAARGVDPQVFDDLEELRSWLDAS
jgi:predicted nucleotidyltransferase